MYGYLTTLIVTLTYYYECSIDVEYFVDKNEIYLKEVHEYEIEDTEWNESVALVSKTIDVKIAASLIYDTEQKSEKEFEFELNT